MGTTRGLSGVVMVGLRVVAAWLEVRIRLAAGCGWETRLLRALGGDNPRPERCGGGWAAGCGVALLDTALIAFGVRPRWRRLPLGVGRATLWATTRGTHAPTATRPSANAFSNC